MRLPAGWKTDGSLAGFEVVRASNRKTHDPGTGIFIAWASGGWPLIRADWEPCSSNEWIGGIFTGSLFEFGHPDPTEQLFTTTVRSLVDWIEVKAEDVGNNPNSTAYNHT